MARALMPAAYITPGDVIEANTGEAYTVRSIDELPGGGVSLFTFSSGGAEIVLAREAEDPVAVVGHVTPVDGGVRDEVLAWPNGELVDVASIEAYAEDARRVAESPLDDGQIVTPDMVVSELGRVSVHASRLVKVIHLAEAHKRRASTRLNRAKAEARITHGSLPASQQTARIVLDVAALQDEYDDAVTAFEYARRIGNLLSDYTGRVQSIGKQVELMWRAETGRGA